MIDISRLVAGEGRDECDLVREIGAACREIGFFYVTGHGIAPATRARVFRMAADFFARARDVKEIAAFSGPGGNRGYIGLGREALAPDRPADMKEAFNIGLDLPVHDPEVLAGKPFRGRNIWPDIPDFRATMLDYYDRMWRLGLLLHRAFAQDLGLVPAFFADKFRRPMATLRLLHYPPVVAPIPNGQLGAGEHTDYGNITLLATGPVGGLMVRARNGRWLEAPVRADAFVCNIGDCLMRWTNDVYVSTPHKVVSPVGVDRYSVAFFFDPDPDAVVACLPTCVEPRRPAKYAPITAADFLMSRLEPTYAGRSAR